VYTHRVRVAYVDTDAAGVVHHSQYLRYLEQARVELQRAVGHDYRRFERERGLALPVVEVHLRYRAPARFDDLLDVTTWCTRGSRARLVFASRIVRLGDDRGGGGGDHGVGTLLHEGEVTLACVDLRTMSLCTMPDDLRAALGVG
jgi:acyl-CoA thioester hydrolase